MVRYTLKDYRRHLLVLMTLYVALMLLEWPYARHAASMPWKVVLSLLPVVPMVALLWIIAKRIMSSDELQQRLHLMALSTSTGIVAALSMAGGFLCATGVLKLDGDILIWVFPTLCITYSVALWLVARRYGGAECG